MSARWADKDLTGWGRVKRAASRVARPERMSELNGIVTSSDPASLLARGAGRSYGDAALNSAGGTLDLTRLDRLLAFDPATGQLVAESGVTFGDLVATFVPQGFLPPVIPGTGFATLGGGIANDVHGKNHHEVGSLGQHLDWFDLRLPGGELRRVSPSSDTDLFKATVGGIGLSGVIERASFKLVSIPSNAMRVRRRRVRDLDEHLAALLEEQSRSPYVVGWIDALAKGKQLGRGILEAASYSSEGVAVARRASRRVPFDFPSIALNPWTVRAFNALYYRKVPSGGSDTLQPIASFLFPLDAIHDWTRIYGKRGFHQFQCVLPFDGGAPALRSLLEAISRSGQGSFLAVLKTMGPAGLGFLSFARPGFTLALDFPEVSGARELIARLETLTADHGGRTYLAKDDTLTPTLLPRMYPEAEAFKATLAKIDPAQRMNSDMARRLGLTQVRP